MANYDEMQEMYVGKNLNELPEYIIDYYPLVDENMKVVEMVHGAEIPDDLELIDNSYLIRK